MGLMELLGWVVALVCSVSFGTGFVMMATPHENFAVGRRCFWVSAIILWGFAVAWGVRENYTFWIRATVCGLLAAVAAVGLMMALHALYAREKSASEAKPATNFAQSDRYAELKSVAKWFGEQENVLRDKADFSGMYRANIAVQIARLRYAEAGRSNEFFYNNYSANGEMIFWAKEGKYIVDQHGVHIVNDTIKDVLILVETQQYIANMKTIDDFDKSALLPENVKEAIRAYKLAVSNNYQIMLQVFDERSHVDSRYFTEAYNSGRFGNVVWEDFVRRFQPLKPFANQVVSAVTDHLDKN